MYNAGVWLSLARAPGLGPGGRRFESCHPDLILYIYMREWLRGGAPPCQGGGRGFESRLALFLFVGSILIFKIFRLFCIFSILFCCIIAVKIIQMFADVGKLCIGILIERWEIFLL